MAEEEKNAPKQDPAGDPKKGPEPVAPSETKQEADDASFNINAGNFRDAIMGSGGSINYNGFGAEDLNKVLGAHEERVRKTFEIMLERVTSFRNMAGFDARSEMFTSLKREREEVVTEHESASAPSSIDDAVELPKTPEELERWYDTLDENDQCFVQAVTVLHGAPLLDVSNAAGELYQALEVTMVSQDNTTSQVSSSPSNASRRGLRRERLKRTCVTTIRVNHVERTVWRSTDVQEQQTFTLRMLHFFSDEFALSYGSSRFSDTLKNWAESKAGECSRKAARASGIILYHQSVDELWRVANAWANSDHPGAWRLAASALGGAYDVHKLDDEKGADNTQKSPIFRLLNQWVQRAHNARNPRVGCAAANAYGHISQKAPEIALNGLERLLCFPESGADANWESISVGVWVESVSNYVGLAWSGQIRNVLVHLAAIAEKLVYQRQLPTLLGEREAYRRRCRLNLEAVFNIFFPIALSSLIGVSDDTPVSYSMTEPQPDRPLIPDEQGKDILLAGILTKAESHWCRCIETLLCAAHFAGKAKEASFFLRQWAEIVLKDSSTEQSQLESTYMEFVVNVGRTVEQWHSDLVTMRLNPPPALRAFIHNLGLWQDRRRPQSIDAFVQKVLQELDIR